MSTLKQTVPQPSFESLDGAVSLCELLDGRGRLVLYHFKFAADAADDMPSGCPGCKMYIDNIDHHALRQLANRDASFAIVSRAPIENVQAYKKRMSWKHRWLASDAALTQGDNHGVSVFTRDARYIYRRYFTISRGTASVGAIWNVLDVPCVGLQEKWEVTPLRRLAVG